MGAGSGAGSFRKGGETLCCEGGERVAGEQIGGITKDGNAAGVDAEEEFANLREGADLREMFLFRQIGAILFELLALRGKLFQGEEDGGELVPAFSDLGANVFEVDLHTEAGSARGRPPDGHSQGQLSILVDSETRTISGTI